MITRRVSQDLLLLTAGAVITAIAYPPFHLLLPSFAGVSPAYLAWRRVATGGPGIGSLRQGLWFGGALYVLSTYWFASALWIVSPILALPGFLAFGLVHALGYSAMFGWAAWLVRRGGVHPGVAFVLTWVTLEWSWAHLGPFAFPWLGLGLSLTGFPVLMQAADLVGTRGLTAVLVSCNVLVVEAAFGRGPAGRRVLQGIGVVVVGAGLGLYGAFRLGSVPVEDLAQVTVVQPNLRPEMKADRARVQALVDAVAEQVRRASDPRSTLVLLPETALPEGAYEDERWAERLGAALPLGTELLTGAIEFRGADRFNAVVRVRRDERADVIYRKRRLVPGIEWTPGGWSADRARAGTVGGYRRGGPAGPVFDGLHGVGILVCFESTFEELTRAYRRAGARWILNVTNDAWFDRTVAPTQHAAHLVGRAIENRIGIVRVANSGSSMVIDPTGRTLQATAIGVAAQLTAMVPVTRATSWYTRWGDWVGRLVVITVLTLTGITWWKPNRKLG